VKKSISEGSNIGISNLIIEDAKHASDTEDEELEERSNFTQRKLTSKGFGQEVLNRGE
jgi:hypothetical protein